jgi:GT2 family glycosyltransferase
MPKISIIVLNYNSWEDTIECMESLLKMTDAHFNIILIDNNSPNDSVIHLRKWLPADTLSLTDSSAANHKGPIPKITFITSAHNGGYAAGNNIGLRFCLNSDPEFEYAWVLNNDTVVHADACANMITEIQKLQQDHPSKKFGLYGNRITHYHDPATDQVSYYTFSSKNATVRAVKTRQPGNIMLDECDKYYPCGASIFVSKQFLLETGLMDEQYFLYYEEPDWSIRAFRKGYTLVIFNSVQVFHKEGASAGSSVIGSQRSELSDYYIIKNRFTIIRKFYPQHLSYVYLTMGGILLNRLRRRQFNRVGMIAGIVKSALLKPGT